MIAINATSSGPTPVVARVIFKEFGIKRVGLQINVRGVNLREAQIYTPLTLKTEKRPFSCEKT